MADQEDDILAIEVDTDDYAETAAGDTPPVPRTYQSEADFQAQRATYCAKIDSGNTYENLIKAVPILDGLKTAQRNEGSTDFEDGIIRKLKLSKKDVQLLGYAVGELYYDKEYGRIVKLCDRVREFCDVDEKTLESLDRWTRRCRERME